MQTSSLKCFISNLTHGRLRLSLLAPLLSSIPLILQLTSSLGSAAEPGPLEPLRSDFSVLESELERILHPVGKCTAHFKGCSAAALCERWKSDASTFNFEWNDSVKAAISGCRSELLRKKLAATLPKELKDAQIAFHKKLLEVERLSLNPEVREDFAKLIKKLNPQPAGLRTMKTPTDPIQELKDWTREQLAIFDKFDQSEEAFEEFLQSVSRIKPVPTKKALALTLVYWEKQGVKPRGPTLELLKKQTEFITERQQFLFDIGTRMTKEKKQIEENTALTIPGWGTPAEQAQLAREKAPEIERSFESVRNSFSQILEAKRTEVNTEIIDDLLFRLRVLKLSLHPDCSNGTNAFYHSGTHTFSICAQLQGITPTALRTVIAHELGHAIDPCTAASPLVQVGLSYFWQEEQYVVDDRGRKGGHLKQADQYPFHSVNTCLSSQESIGARAILPAERKRDLEALYQAATDPEEKLAWNELLEKHEQGLDRFWACGSLTKAGGFTQIQEAFSDWIAAQDLSRRVRATVPEMKSTTALRGLGFFLSSACGSSSEKQFEELKTWLRKYDCDLPSDNPGLSENPAFLGVYSAEVERDFHQHSFDRIERIFLAEPALRDALGCTTEDPQPRRCE